MPVPLVPYPSQPQMMQAPPPPGGSQGHLVCNGCRRLLVYPLGATNVRCALCSCVTAVSPHGADVAQLICGGCRTLLMYSRGASSVQCSCCNTVNLVMEANQVAQVNCGGCSTLLMYPYGAQSVKCAVCQFVTTIALNRMPLPPQRPAYIPSPQPVPGLQPPSQAQTQTVVVENPMTLDENGKLVSNVAVGVTSEKK